MPRHINPPKSIADYGGLKPFLDQKAHEHNGLQYRDFISRINPKRKHRVPRPVIAEDFNVSARTIYAWIKVHERELKLASSDSEKTV